MRFLLSLLNFFIHKIFRLLFLGLLTTANYNQKFNINKCCELNDKKTSSEFKILLIAKNDFK
jgi:hypothetical protein